MANLDIVIPVYNEGKNIVPVLDALANSVRTPFRVLICYDFDEDSTLSALRDYRPRFALECIKNQGKGAHGAVTSGFRASQAPAVLVFPADDTCNAGIVDAMYRQVVQEGCDVVAASRFIEGGCMVNCPWFKGLLVRLASLTMHHLGGLPIHDATNGFRMFSRRLLEQVPIESSQGFTYGIELTAKCHRLGWKLGEVPARWYERTNGKSRFRVYRWLLPYLRWYVYFFGTTYLFRRSTARA